MKVLVQQRDQGLKSLFMAAFSLCRRPDRLDFDSEDITNEVRGANGDIDSAGGAQTLAALRPILVSW
jgi:hypothetical protein